MTRHSVKRAGAVLLLLTFALTAAVVPQFARPHSTAAQTTQTNTPLQLCGTLSAYSQTAVTFTTNGVNVTFQIAQANTFVVQSSQIGQDLCFVGQLNNQTQIVSGTLTPNFSSPVVVCGNVSLYVPSSASTTGFITIGSSSIPIGINASLTGTTIAVGQNLCINGQVNALGQLTVGAVSANAGGTAPSTPISACGTISGYTAPGASNGAVTVSTPTVTVSFVIVAGATVNPTGFTGTSGSNQCLVGTLNAGGQLTRVTFSPNSSQTITLCGVVTAYTAASSTQTGSLTIGGLVVPLALSASFSGQPIVVQNNVCVTGSFNGLGQLVTGTIAANPNAPTATPTVTQTPTATATGTTVPATATPTATATATGTAVPPTATPTATATATAAPATATATATAVPPVPTPTPKPAKKYSATFGYVSVWYHYIRVGTQETVVVQAKKHVQHGIWLTVHFPSGRFIAYYTNTDKHGFWSTRFTVPANGVSRFTSEAVVTAQLWYKKTTTKTFDTFFLVR